MREAYVAGVLKIQPDIGPIPAHWNVYFQVSDVDSSLQSAMDLDGEKVHNTVDMPTVSLVGIKDPQGDIFTNMRRKLSPS